MIGLLQRVSEARVTVDEQTVGVIGPGLLVLVGVERGDGPQQVQRLLERLLGYRVFEDEAGRMNRSVRDVGGGLLLVPQFTLAADTSRGMRPGFSQAADPKDGAELFALLVERASQAWTPVATGRFGARMNVSLTNQGPVTFCLRVQPGEPGGGRQHPGSC